MAAIVLMLFNQINYIFRWGDEIVSWINGALKLASDGGVIIYIQF